ncbi:uncharacterized protein TRIADDRAFT_53574 [Trichoplax adhaerens]|uniref:Beta-chimaerin n=1 Tax=Trichoplax adhaerens TaxID=10228 RepID=B3RPK6_TRIAD|nr:hypothetical protein TRIADDRAFT_53574 [Trichoplax adhaerens]EDV28207.1 hypothetical protein TRIADDRAFT_53574 [Trichoplax adhaerens]|eukprot:XP_002110041.1 hypothetical protein TRIADDRAFT_53574 [Trichoplax adhaerens]
MPLHYGNEYHGAIAREDTNKLLLRDGFYLVRESLKSLGNYSLSFKLFKEVKHYRLYFDGSHHFIDEKKYDTVYDLVEDGLISLYVTTKGRNYIDRLFGWTDFKGSEAVDNVDGKSTMDKKRNTSTASNASIEGMTEKMMSFVGFHWCDYCRNFMWGLKQQGARCKKCGYCVHKQCINRVITGCTPKKTSNRVFGIDLTALLSLTNTPRPLVFDKCVEAVESWGIDTEGLYREPGSATDVKILKSKFDEDDTKVELTPQLYPHIQVITSLLKLYLRELPVPLIPYHQYNAFIEIVDMKHEIDKVNTLKQLLSALPPAHYDMLKHLVQHLNRVIKHEDKNLMSASNLGVVFGPSIMKTPISEEGWRNLTDMRSQRLVVENLILLNDKLF